MSEALFQRTGSADFPVWLKCMITGPPKSGKTSFLGTVPNIVIADTEPFANNLQSVAHLNLPFVTVRSTNDLHKLRFVLNDETLRQQAAEQLGMAKIEAVAIDTLDTLQKIMKAERMREQRASKFLRDDWGWLKTEMEAMIEAFTALPIHVFFIVHTKSKDIGTEDNPRTVILPGLEGSIAESIAGMVGYSLLSYRKEEIRTDGSKFTKYWLRAEGDETYEFLGNRAAGQLPDVIEPHFKVLHDTALAGRPKQAAPAPVQMPEIQRTEGQQALPQASVGMNVGQQNTNSANSVTEVSTSQPAPAPNAVDQSPAQAEPAPQAKPADEEPVNAAALGHLKKVYDAILLPFPEEVLKGLTLGQARNLVRMWQAAQQDAAEGKGGDPRQVMREFVTAQGWVTDKAPEAPDAPVEPKVDGTIEQVKAYVGDDLARANEAFEIERTGKNRVSLMQWLESKGASHGGVQTPVQSEPTQAPEAAVTQPAPAADDTPTEDQAVQNVQAGLGGTVISTEINADAKCEECGGPIDDVDLAQLGRDRFSRLLCVNDYIAETKKPRG